MISFFFALIVAYVLFAHQCFASNATINIYGLSNYNVSHAWDSVYGSVISADRNALTVHLNCRPSLPSPCDNQDATITAGPSTWDYTSSSSTYFAHMGCSKTEQGGDFTCTWHNKLRDRVEVSTVRTIQGGGGEAPMVITAGLEKLASATFATNVTHSSSGGSSRADFIPPFGGTFYLVILFLGWIFAL